MACQDFPNCKNTEKVPRDQEDIARAVTAFAEDGSELDPDKLHLAQKLLKYYHFCTKASLRQGGFEDAFKLSPDIIELPENFWEKIEASDEDSISITDERGHDVHRTYKKIQERTQLLWDRFLLLEKYLEKQKTEMVFQDNLLHRSVLHFSMLQQL